MTAELIHGCCLQEMAAMKAAGRTVDAVVCDPPYEIGMMNKHWDRTGIAFRAETWRLAYDLLKPGGYLVAFGGSRTYHRIACAIEDAGFEIRDSLWYLNGSGPLLWTYGSGFPKSRNVSNDLNQHRCLCGVREPAAVSPAVPSRPVLQPEMRGSGQGAEGRLHHAASLGDGADVRVSAGQGRVRQPHRPEPVEQPSEQSGTVSDERGPQAWGGWPVCGGCGKPIVPEGLGTALKPAVEPIVFARKPLSEKSVAANVLKHGTGALNIDACRVATDENLNSGAYSGSLRRRAEYSSTDQAEGAVALSRLNRGSGEYEQPAGRWPPNILHSGDPEVLAAFARFGERKNGGQNYLGGDRESMFGNKAVVSPTRYAGDTGSAARFFPALGYDEDELRFCYAAKASRAERMGASHPTIKPAALLSWLVRLINPPGGTVLDPFSGSGTTGIACLREGFDCVLIEKEAEYVEMIKSRLRQEQARQQGPREQDPQLALAIS